MTTKNYDCWGCQYFQPDDVLNLRSGRCHRFAPHSLDYYGFAGVEIETPLTDKGDLLTHDGIEEVRLPVGTDGQVLKSNSAAPNGVEWDNESAGSPLTTKGDVFTHNGVADAREPVGADGQALIADSTTANGMKWRNPTPLTTKGDVMAHSGSEDTRVPVGTNGQVLTADSAEASGVKWDTPAGGSPLTTKGDIYTRNAGTDTRLPIGADGQQLIADSAETTGQKWIDRSFIHSYQCARIGTYQGPNELDFTRNGATPASPPYPVASQFNDYDNGGEYPFAVPPNSEIIAVQANLSKGAVSPATVGANPHLRVFFYDIDGNSDTYRGVASIPIPQAKVSANGNTGTPDYHVELYKLPTPISPFTNGGFMGLRLAFDQPDNEVIWAVRHLSLTVYMKTAYSEVLDSGLITMAMATDGGDEKAYTVTPDESGELEAPETADLKVSDEDAPAQLPATMSLSLSPSETPTSQGKYSLISDAGEMWCGEYKPKAGTVPPIPLP